jgi:LytS/YehU family sensor histidine kinase
MENIRNRISPHFVYNVLNVIIPPLEQYKELNQPFRLLIQMLRNNLLASEKIVLSLEEEIDLVKNYLQLYALRDPGKVQVNWEISTETKMETLIPSMSIQIPVENALKYAFETDKTDAQIRISITQKTEVIGIVIEDNGSGYNSENKIFNKQGTGTGLKTLIRTIDLLNSKNNKKIVFIIENVHPDALSRQGTRVAITIPVEYRFDL